MKIFISIILLSICLSASEYEQWLKEQSNQFGQYKKKMDAEFAQMLKEDWEAFQSMYKDSPYETPKPKTIPKAPEPKKEKLKKKIPFITLPKKEPAPKPKPKPKPEPKKQSYDERKAFFDFFGNSVKIFYKPGLEKNYNSFDKETIGNFWQEASKLETKHTLSQLKKSADTYRLNDWGVYQLVYGFAQSISSDRANTNLKTWYLLLKMGYDVKIAYNKSEVYLLGNIAHQLYQVAFFNLDGSKYYVLSPSGSAQGIDQVYTYKGSYPDAKKQMAFGLRQSLALGGGTKTKKISFRTEGESYTFDATLNDSLINFYQTLPQSAYSIYQHAKSSPKFDASLLLQLRKHLQDKTMNEAINFLLAFVQHGFAYKTDDEQFSREKVMLPEETVHYPYSDCEDRSMLFIYLVKNLTDIEVVGIKYDSHYATALALDADIHKPSFQYQNTNYVIADPTYINARLGMEMPRYKGKSFKVIE